ncbi:MAG: hypothetical protein KKB31_07015 [Nanoarchaeota archaeon]|nr:hypothetical protein [Nanoarchaeota archaeon]
MRNEVSYLTKFKMENKMNAKNILVSFLAIVTVFAVMATVSAGVIGTIDKVKVDGVHIWSNPTVQAGDEVVVKVYFTATADDRDVTMTVTLDTGKEKVSATTDSFRVRNGSEYIQAVALKVPYELDDELFDTAELEVEIEGKDHDISDTYEFTVERQQYELTVKSITANQQLTAGETFPIDVVVKNTGYYDLDDTFVTVSIPELNVHQTKYFDEVFAIDGYKNYGEEGSSADEDDDYDDTVHGTLHLEVPFGVDSGIYTLEVTVENDDTSSTKAMQVVVDNDFARSVFKSGNSLWIVNPTDSVAGYRVIVESPASVSESMIFVPAGASQSIEVMPNAEGEYSFDVTVLTMSGELVDTVTFSGNADNGNDSDSTDPIVILTVILAIVFIVLLVVLIVLIGKKPEKSGEFGESYY